MDSFSNIDYDKDGKYIEVELEDGENICHIKTEHYHELVEGI